MHQVTRGHEGQVVAARGRWVTSLLGGGLSKVRRPGPAARVGVVPQARVYGHLGELQAA